MSTVEVRLEVPGSLSRQQLDAARQAAREGIVLHLFQRGTISGRKAAQLLGHRYVDFLEFLGTKGVAVSGTYDRAAAESLTRALRRSGHGKS